MSEENLVEDTQEEVVETPEGEEAAEKQQEPDRDYEAEALEMGWVPKEEFKGDPDRWTDAQKFVERGETLIPFLRADKRKLEEKLENTSADFAKRLERMETMHKKREEQQAKQFEQRLKDVKAAQMKAMRDGDEDEYLRLDQERDELQKDAAQTQGNDDQSTQSDWMTQNSWYNDDFDMTQAANQYSQMVASKNPNMSMSDNLAKVDKFMREKFPAKFGLDEPKPKPRQTVDSGSRIQPSPFQKTAKGYSALPDEAKALCAQDIKDGLFKDKDEWAKEYFANG